MKLLSTQYLLFKAKQSLIRFPLPILSSLIGVCIAIYLTEYNSEIDNKFPYINLLLTCALAVPLYFCATVLAVKQHLSTTIKTAVFGSVTILLFLVYWSLPDSEITNNTSLPYIKYAIYNIIAHLLVSFIPYVDNQKINGFWNYNKLLFIRILTSMLYSGFLYIGILITLFALKMLFSVEIHDKLYFDIFIVIAGLFNTWFFVAGIPEDFEALENETNYPKGLKIFTQYVLLPFLIIYLLILYAYGTKIIALWDWPKGIVSYLISFVSILGIFTFLLMYPYGNDKENVWIKKVSNLYYYITLPLLVLLFIAISFRLDEYGITINRYIIFLLGVWLSVVSIYFCLKQKNIKFIPISLAVLMGLMSFGPWGMFSLSERSQVNRLKSILETHSILKNNQIQNEVMWEKDSLPHTWYSKKEQTNSDLLKDSIHNEVMSILDYLDDHHGFTMVKPLFKQNISQLIAKDTNRVNEARVIMETMGLEYVTKYKNDIENTYTNYSAINQPFVSLKGYDYLISFSFYSYENDNVIKQFDIENNHFVLKKTTQNTLVLLQNNVQKAEFNLQNLTNNLAKSYKDEYNNSIPLETLTLAITSDKIQIKLEIHELSVNSNKESFTINNFNGNLLLKFL